MTRPQNGPDPALTRRRFGAGAVAVVATTGLAGCSTVAPGPSGTSGATPTAAPDEADLGVVAAALAAERALLDALERTARRHPRLDLADATRIHRAHTELLAGAGPDPVPEAAPAARVPARPGDAVQALVRAEAELVRTQTRHAGVARSGQLAGVLASLAASAGQLQVTLAGAAR